MTSVQMLVMSLMTCSFKASGNLDQTSRGCGMARRPPGRERNSRIASRVHFVPGVRVSPSRLVEETGMRSRIVSR